jgi:hypothetical protein
MTVTISLPAGVVVSHHPSRSETNRLPFLDHLVQDVPDRARIVQCDRAW